MDFHTVYFNNQNFNEHLNFGPVGIDYQHGKATKIILRTAHMEFDNRDKYKSMFELADKFMHYMHEEHGKWALPDKWGYSQLKELIMTSKTSFNTSIDVVPVNVMNYIEEHYIKK